MNGCSKGSAGGLPKIKKETFVSFALAKQSIKHKMRTLFWNLCLFILKIDAKSLPCFVKVFDGETEVIPCSWVSF